jgi:hypothetical protein
MAYILFIGFMRLSTHLVLRIISPRKNTDQGDFLLKRAVRAVGLAKIQRVQQKIPGCWTYVQQNENKFQKVCYLHIKFL